MGLQGITNKDPVPEVAFDIPRVPKHFRLLLPVLVVSPQDLPVHFPFANSAATVCELYREQFYLGLPFWKSRVKGPHVVIAFFLINPHGVQRGCHLGRKEWLGRLHFCSFYSPQDFIMGALS